MNTVEREVTSTKINRETYERFKLYSDVTGKSIRESVDEALNFWMDTAGAVEILFQTGVETVPEFAESEQHFHA